MNKKVAIDDSLKEHIEFLEQSGYEVDRFANFEDTGKIHSFDYDAIVVSSAGDIPMGGTSFRPGAPVVEAKDKSPEEVFNLLRERYYFSVDH